MLFFICPSCGMLLADKQIPFEKGMERICSGKKSQKNIDDAKKKLLYDVGAERYCCRMRILTYVDKIKLIM